MSNKKISELNTVTTISPNDLLVISRQDYNGAFQTYKVKASAITSAGSGNSSGITKLDIESKLTGEIGSHYHSWNNITNKPLLSTVAISGNYNDLINKPSAVNNATISLVQGGSVKGSFTTNQDNNVTITLDSTTNNTTLGESSTTAYRGDRGRIAYDHSQTTHAPTTAQKNSDITKAEIEAKLTGTLTSHSHTKATIGLGNVDNTADSDKPISTAVQTALSNKQNTLVSGSTIKTFNGSSILGSGNITVAVNDSDVTAAKLTGIESQTATGTVVGTDSVLKAIAKLRQQIATLTAPPPYTGPVTDIGGEGHYPFLQSDGTLYLADQVITMQPGRYRFLIASSPLITSSPSMTSKTTKVTRVSTLETLVEAFNGYYNGNRVDRFVAQGVEDRDALQGSTVWPSNDILKFAFAGANILNKGADRTVMGTNYSSPGCLVLSQVLNFVEPTELRLILGAPTAVGGPVAGFDLTTEGRSFVWIREVPAP